MEEIKRVNIIMFITIGLLVLMNTISLAYYESYSLPIKWTPVAISILASLLLVSAQLLLGFRKLETSQKR